MKEYTYNRISQEEYSKALGQFRLQLNGALKPLRCYGLDVYVDGATEEVIHLVEQFAMRVRGRDIPIQMRGDPVRRPTD